MVNLIFIPFWLFRGVTVINRSISRLCDCMWHEFFVSVSVRPVYVLSLTQLYDLWHSLFYSTELEPHPICAQRLHAGCGLCTLLKDRPSRSEHSSSHLKKWETLLNVGAVRSAYSMFSIRSVIDTHCIIWMYYSLVKLHLFNFRVIIVFLRSTFFRFIQKSNCKRLLRKKLNWSRPFLFSSKLMFDYVYRVIYIKDIPFCIRDFIRNTCIRFN